MFVRITNSDGTFRSLASIIDDVLYLTVMHCEGKKTIAAKQLKVPRSTFYSKFKAGE
jgi:transcriptional regulator of acetoin/glycerol metabolism